MKILLIRNRSGYGAAKEREYRLLEGESAAAPAAVKSTTHGCAYQHLVPCRTAVEHAPRLRLITVSTFLSRIIETRRRSILTREQLLVRTLNATVPARNFPNNHHPRDWVSKEMDAFRRDCLSENSPIVRHQKIIRLFLRSQSLCDISTESNFDESG